MSKWCSWSFPPGLWRLHSAPCSCLLAQGTGYSKNNYFTFKTEGKKAAFSSSFVIMFPSASVKEWRLSLTLLFLLMYLKNLDFFFLILFRAFRHLCILFYPCITSWHPYSSPHFPAPSSKAHKLLFSPWVPVKALYSKVQLPVVASFRIVVWGF